ncbi:MAG: restriction endonuclease subunit S [Bacillota bacterium]
MAGEWRELTWGDLATLEYGRALRGYAESKGRFRVFGTNGPVGWYDEALCCHPSVIIGRKGAYRGVHYSPAPFFVIDTAFYLEPKSEIDARWAYYELLTQDINGMDSGSAIPSTSREAFYNLPVLVPPPAEQRAIAHILGTLDDKIELNRRMSETLEEMARALFKSWFVDFAPVRAKAEGRNPGLPKPLADLFPARLVDSELGEIPEGWEVGKLGDVVEHLRDSENPLDSPDAVFRHFSIPAFDDGQWPTLEHGASIKSLKFRVPLRVVLLSKLNPEIERVWLVDIQPGDRAVCSTEFLVLAPRSRYGRTYAYCGMRSPIFRQDIEGLVTGTSKSHQRAQPSAILGMAIVMPTAAINAAFERLACPLADRLLECRRESRTLAALRDALLPKLISGKLRVRDAEKFIARAV